MPQTPKERLSALNLALPKTATPAGNLVGFKIDHGLVYVSGQLPLQDGVVRYLGRVGDTVSQEAAYEAAKLAALNVISQLSIAAGGDLARIELVRVSGFLCCASGFTNIAAVVNGASDLFVEIFGERGAHSRSAIGVAALPRGVPVEIEVIARLLDQEI
ncbi:RidA family protein [Mesorhizobium sp.]|uniref:RidA family protein n=1 Tax=Mesorhizobium sp. TaxID=1871066 RepID=UPI0012027A89|nr:RidA family protein [Mesorhizobium sp.]TIP43764.1 MAG: RidA family protein [Mesorhizobium sp.]